MDVIIGAHFGVSIFGCTRERREMMRIPLQKYLCDEGCEEGGVWKGGIANNGEGSRERDRLGTFYLSMVIYVVT